MQMRLYVTVRSFGTALRFMKCIVFVPLIFSFPCANCCNSFANDSDHTFLCFSLLIRCRYSSSLPVSGHTIVLTRYSGTYWFGSSGHIFSISGIGDWPNFRAGLKLVIFGGSSMITELSMILAWLRRLYHGSTRSSFVVVLCDAGNQQK